MLMNPLILASPSSASLRFFVYPGPMGSEENQFTAEYSAWGK